MTQEEKAEMQKLFEEIEAKTTQEEREEMRRMFKEFEEKQKEIIEKIMSDQETRIAQIKRDKEMLLEENFVHAFEEFIDVDEYALDFYWTAVAYLQDETDRRKWEEAGDLKGANILNYTFYNAETGKKEKSKHYYKILPGETTEHFLNRFCQKEGIKDPKAVQDLEYHYDFYDEYDKKRRKK